MTVPAPVPALEPVPDFLRKAVRLGLELLAALLLVIGRFWVVAAVQGPIPDRQVSEPHRETACGFALNKVSLARWCARHALRRLPGVCRGGIPVESPAVLEPDTGFPFRTGNAGPRPRTPRAISFTCARWGCTVVYGRAMATAGRTSCQACLPHGQYRTAHVYVSRARVGVYGVYGSAMAPAGLGWPGGARADRPAVPESTTRNPCRSDDAAALPSCQGDLSSRPLPHGQYRTAPLYVSRTRVGAVRWRTVRRRPPCVRFRGGGSLACWPGVAWVEGREGRRRRTPSPYPAPRLREGLRSRALRTPAALPSAGQSFIVTCCTAGRVQLHGRRRFPAMRRA